MLQISHYFSAEPMAALGRVIGMVLLVGMTVADIKDIKVSVSILMIGSVLASFSCLLSGKDQIISGLAGLGVGFAFVLVSKVTKEGLGYGDSWLICVLGMYLGMGKLVEALLAAWFLAAAAAILLLAVKRCRRKSTLPMIPFLLAGYLAVWMSEMMN